MALGLGLAFAFVLQGACNQELTGGESSDDLGVGGNGDGGIADLSIARNKDAACAAVKAEATLVKKPVDIILVIDNSGSMGDEIAAVERNVNQNFADILTTSSIDYRVILISKHGKSNPDESVCITKPLSGNATCNPPTDPPVNGPRFFHYDTEIASTNSLSLILSTYNAKDKHGLAPNGWAGWLRADAYKVFLEITDDNSALSETSFETQLFAKVPAMFGTAAARNYVFHTIAGLKENNPPTNAWGPKDPLQMAECTKGGGAENNGLVYQRLSVLTGGLRFPICEYASFDAVFRNVATGVVQGTQVACDFKIPDAPAGQVIDENSVLVDYQPGAGGPVQELKRANGAAQCTPTSFYIQNGRIVLCPDTCSTIQKDEKAKLQVFFDCQIG